MLNLICEEEKMSRSLIVLLLLLLCSHGKTIGAETTIIIDSWRADDKVWNEKIIPAFNKHHPDIKVIFRSPEDGNSAKWNATMDERFEKGEAGDLITCRPFDHALDLFQKGYLMEMTEIRGMENFPSFAKAAWQTDSGAQNFCLPLASVIHGFFYNKTIFEKLGINEPATTEQFYHVLETVKKAGYIPLAIGTKDKWEIATMGFQNIGPNYWKGEDGRYELINGETRLDGKPYIEVFQHLKRWSSYMGQGYEQRSYNDAIELFASGKAAIYPAGSWDIMQFYDKIDLGVFKPPMEREEDNCYFSDHIDIGMGINAASKNIKAAESFLAWMATREFSMLFTNEISGFFSLSNHFFEVNNPIAQKMMLWREQCDSTIRNTAQILTRGEPNLELEIWETSLGVMTNTMTPVQAVARLQRGLEGWYEPQKTSKQPGNHLDCDPN